MTHPASAPTEPPSAPYRYIRRSLRVTVAARHVALRSARSTLQVGDAENIWELAMPRLPPLTASRPLVAGSLAVGAGRCPFEFDTDQSPCFETPASHSINTTICLNVVSPVPRRLIKTDHILVGRRHL